jgi:hypothetical protein
VYVAVSERTKQKIFNYLVCITHDGKLKYKAFIGGDY